MPVFLVFKGNSRVLQTDAEISQIVIFCENPDMEIHIQDYIYSKKGELSTLKNCGFPLFYAIL
jgi:hypothetical protein